MIVPNTLEQLRHELDRAREEYELCQFIDYYPDVKRCRDRWQHQIDYFEARIAELKGGTS